MIKIIEEYFTLKPNLFLALPAEIKNNIFDFLTSKERLLVINLVCKNFNLELNQDEAKKDIFTQKLWDDFQVKVNQQRVTFITVYKRWLEYRNQLTTVLQPCPLWKQDKDGNFLPASQNKEDFYTIAKVLLGFHAFFSRKLYIDIQSPPKTLADLMAEGSQDQRVTPMRAAYKKYLAA